VNAALQLINDGAVATGTAGSFRHKVTKIAVSSSEFHIHDVVITATSPENRVSNSLRQKADPSSSR
jgi:hypothetical protein